MSNTRKTQAPLKKQYDEKNINRKFSTDLKAVYHNCKDNYISANI